MPQENSSYLPQTGIEYHVNPIAFNNLESRLHSLWRQCTNKSSYSSVSASDHRGGPTWSCFLMADCCVSPHAWFSLQVDQYCDTSHNSSSSQIDSLSCGKFGTQWELCKLITISVVIIHTVAATHGNPIICNTAISTIALIMRAWEVCWLFAILCVYTAFLNSNWLAVCIHHRSHAECVMLNLVEYLKESPHPSCLSSAVQISSCELFLMTIWPQLRNYIPYMVLLFTVVN